MINYLPKKIIKEYTYLVNDNIPIIVNIYKHINNMNNLKFNYSTYHILQEQFT